MKMECSQFFDRLLKKRNAFHFSRTFTKRRTPNVTKMKCDCKVLYMEFQGSSVYNEEDPWRRRQIVLKQTVEYQQEGSIMRKIFKKISVTVSYVLLFTVLIPIAVLFFLLCFLEPVIVRLADWGSR